MASWQAEGAGLIVLGALLLLPGLVAVRAPWPQVPLLSAACWILSTWWLDLLDGSRRRFLIGSLACLAVLAALRLLRAPQPTPPRWPAALVVACALARVAPYAAWPVAPGIDMSLHSVSTLLFVGRDGIPRTYEPLLPIDSFGAYTPGLHSLAADVSLISGLPAHRSAFLVSAAAYGLLQLALFDLLRRFFDARVAGVASVAALALARAPQSFFGWGGNTSVLALALLVAAAALRAGGGSRRSAAAAGVLLAATMTAHVVIAFSALALLPLVFHLCRRSPIGEQRAVVGRYLLAGLVALAASVPYLLRLGDTLSAGERAWLSEHLRTHDVEDWARSSGHHPLALARDVVATLDDAFLWLALAGAVIALRRQSPALPAVAVSVALLVGLAGTARWGGLGPLAVLSEHSLALVALLLSAGLAILVHALLTRRGWIALVALLAISGTALERFQRYYLSAARTMMISADDLDAMAWIRAHTRALDVICNDYGTPGMWAGALAGRRISEPQFPPFHFDEFRQAGSARGCAYRYVSGSFFFGAPRPPRADAGRPVFENASVRVLTSFDTGDRNLGTRKP